MNYRRRYYDFFTQEFLTEFQSNFLAEVGDYVTINNKRYVVAAVFAPYQLTEFAPHIVNILCVPDEETT